jgi:hypothetical protein
LIFTHNKKPRNQFTGYLYLCDPCKSIVWFEDLLFLFGMTSSDSQAFHLVVRVSPDRYLSYRVGPKSSRNEETFPDAIRGVGGCSPTYRVTGK